MSGTNACETLRMVPGTQEMDILRSLLSLPVSTRESAEPPKSVVTVVTALDSVLCGLVF